MNEHTHQKLTDVIEQDLAGLAPALRGEIERLMPLLLPLLTKWMKLGWSEYVGVSFSEKTDLPLPKPIQIALDAMERIRPVPLTEQQMQYNESGTPHYLKSDE